MTTASILNNRTTARQLNAITASGGHVYTVGRPIDGRMYRFIVMAEDLAAAEAEVDRSIGASLTGAE